ncbi:LEC14B homolog [Juglans regia]|uniref:LEC14B homolog n=1 Tax=Juglans regia TaxID=51240 RepID=A0A6P9DX02_JUGRE|nr:LEC14B homolog [Juglans regia]
MQTEFLKNVEVTRFNGQNVVQSRRVERMKSQAYVSQFSADGSLFVAGFQESHIRIYNVNRGWKVQKDILTKSLRWTITDTSLSPDQHYLIRVNFNWYFSAFHTMPKFVQILYFLPFFRVASDIFSGMVISLLWSMLVCHPSPVVHIVNVGSPETESLANIMVTGNSRWFGFSGDKDGDKFGIFSVKFSNDGRELVAASSNNSIYVYDLEAKKLSLQIKAHMSDVNTVCFADESGLLIYSGSDDNLCKVWDRRCFITKG